jgi:hypothetical protein
MRPNGLGRRDRQRHRRLLLGQGGAYGCLGREAACPRMLTVVVLLFVPWFVPELMAIARVGVLGLDSVRVLFQTDES